MIQYFRRFLTLRNAEGGISAVEFALIAPLMVLIYCGCIELSFMMVLDRKVTSSAATLGDLVARASTVDDEDLDDIIQASRMIFQPEPIAEARLRISSLYDDEGTIRVAWSDAQNLQPYDEDEVIAVPDDLVPDGGSVIYSEVEYDYESTIGYLFTTKKTLADEFYLRPRRADFVARIRD